MATTLQDSLSSFGITQTEQQIALLDNMLLDGLLQQREVWDSLQRINHLTPIKPGGAAQAYDVLASALQDARAYNVDHFDARKLLSADLSDGFSKQDLQDWLTYSRQTAFGRSNDMDYRHLPEDTRPEEIQTRYYANSRILGRVDTVNAPAGKQYDESWLQCASRIRIASRLESLLEVDGGTDQAAGDIRIATGKARDAMVPFDGITIKDGDKVVQTAVEEGKTYLTGLAQRLGRPMGNPPFTPVDPARPDGQQKANVEPPLTETDIAYDIISERIPPARIIQTGNANNIGYSGRIDTYYSTTPLAEQLVKRIVSGQFDDGRTPDAAGKKHIVILNVADQPFIPRMDAQVKLLVANALKNAGLQDQWQVDIDTIGKGCSINSMPFIRSDAAAWAQQQHEVMQTGEDRKRPLEELLFRNKSLRNEWAPPPFPSLAERIQSRGPGQTTRGIIR
ncbi:MAG TPA: hypothetical protein VFT64_11385 [Rickettsiales bacterium]|nr:hypothetical protein [Rickettsiales bacterium]